MLKFIIFSSPLLTDDNTSTDESTPKIPSTVPNNKMSPELVPSYGKFLKSFLDKRIKNGPGVWNKENGESIKEKVNRQIHYNLFNFAIIF